MDREARGEKPEGRGERKEERGEKCHGAGAMSVT